MSLQHPWCWKQRVSFVLLNLLGTSWHPTNGVNPWNLCQGLCQGPTPSQWFRFARSCFEIWLLWNLIACSASMILDCKCAAGYLQMEYNHIESSWGKFAPRPQTSISEHPLEKNDCWGFQVKIYQLQVFVAIRGQCLTFELLIVSDKTAQVHQIQLALLSRYFRILPSTCCLGIKQSRSLEPACDIHARQMFPTCSQLISTGPRFLFMQKSLCSWP